MTTPPMQSSPILVTGAAGFIGFHLSRRLLADGQAVVGADSVNDYYDRKLKEARLDELAGYPAFRFMRGDLTDSDTTTRIFEEAEPQRVAHLAAQAGVRYSLEAPSAYVDSNLVALGNVLEASRRHEVRHLVFASSSSVYGANRVVPFSEDQRADHPLSLYAATKRAGELMGHSYAHLFDISFTALRIFSTYGPWGRPDMALFKFSKAILEGQPIDVFDSGQSVRNYTFVDDVVEAFARVLEQPPARSTLATGESADPALATAPFRIYNVGSDSPVALSRMIDVLEASLGRVAIRRLLPPHPGDVPVTAADCSELERATGFQPRITIEEGIPRFVNWYRTFFRV